MSDSCVFESEEDYYPQKASVPSKQLTLRSLIITVPPHLDEDGEGRTRRFRNAFQQIADMPSEGNNPRSARLRSHSARAPRDAGERSQHFRDALQRIADLPTETIDYGNSQRRHHQAHGKI
ncbi:unnamed protein product [Rotaria magnacalcarata]|uniref:Uncharacterized protein n=1 Tax=Rotaria magnacalcarata TaxID=392030 RepID=A0A816AV42_9BILA|nr:unnamed protein product [Rotaria magnacalcarata]CAF2098306.1 unnamed protein product [Rotaria magnacalcarata]